MKKYYGVIYKITNKINGKIYIGQTKNSFKTRYKYNFEKYTTNYLIKKDLKKYGIENFEINEEFDFANSKEELNEKEIFWINYYGGYYSDKTYNLTEGGENGLGIYTKIGKYNIHGELIDILKENNKLKNNIAKRINQNNGDIIKYQKFYYKYLEVKGKKINLNKNDYIFLSKEIDLMEWEKVSSKQKLKIEKINNILEIKNTNKYLLLLLKINEKYIHYLEYNHLKNYKYLNNLIKTKIEIEKKDMEIINKLKNDISMEKIAKDLGYAGKTSISKRLNNLIKKILLFF